MTSTESTAYPSNTTLNATSVAELAPCEPTRLCHTFPLRNGRYMAQAVLPADLSKSEADRLCAFIMALVV